MPDATQTAPAPRRDKRGALTPARMAAMQAARVQPLTQDMTTSERQAWFDRLAQRTQTMLIMRATGMTHGEIALNMHITVQTVGDVLKRADPHRLYTLTPADRKTAAIARWQALELRASEAITDDKLAESSASQLVMMAAIARDKQAQAEAILSPEVAAQVESVEVTLRRRWTTTRGGSGPDDPANNSGTNHAKSCDDAQVIDVEDVTSAGMDGGDDD